eukprot:CAMPEP_0182537518 /NCGR_PEP_ID=MMETSP1323-20130603/22087_1 /TAXON_ID=236787 /ORGANISM="Florenciella parvula, Strain RCC1693" /LENGTH=66 /DNA_ID=CAMNT_0024747903 /DNA_START=167 /DNA_END=364 /DNA_ORIENTATION=-
MSRRAGQVDACVVEPEPPKHLAVSVLQRAEPRHLLRDQPLIMLIHLQPLQSHLGDAINALGDLLGH